MPDFKDSYQQKHWEFALAAHERYIHIIEILKRNGMSAEYWENAKQDIETRYPSLKGTK